MQFDQSNSSTTVKRNEFIRSLKLLIAKPGRLQTIYSDNAKIFTAAASWIKKVVKNETVRNFLAHQEIKWKFNLSRAPWWGGQFERLIELTKNTVYKSIGSSMLTWNELEEVLLDIELTLNNRPLIYVEDNVQLPVLTPNTFLHEMNVVNLEEASDKIDEYELRKRSSYLQKRKEKTWTRWRSTYLKALCEQHNLKHKSHDIPISKGDVVLIKDEEKNRGKWNIGIVQHINKGKDGNIHSVKLRCKKTILERAIQHLYPMELTCLSYKAPKEVVLDPNARDFSSKRNAAVAANERIKEVTYHETELPDAE